MKFAEVKKAAMAGATALAGMEGIAAMATQADVHPYLHAVALGFAAVVTGATWVVRNKQTVDQVLSAFEGDEVVADAVIDRVTDEKDVVEIAVLKHPTVAEQLVADYRD